MLTDLHAHFPMHLMPGRQQMTHEHAGAWLRHRAEAQAVDVVSHFENYEGPAKTPSVTAQLMRDGQVGVALSVLYQFFAEMDLRFWHGAPPHREYFEGVLEQLTVVEDYAEAHPTDVAVAHSPEELDALSSLEVPILIHAVEGGFHVGEDEHELRRNVAELARRGVAYITVAHLFFRRVATNAPALPFLPDQLYHRCFPQAGGGLTALGRVLVEAMLDEGILVDITHMSRRSILDVFELLDAHDPGREIPVIATHMAYRFGGLEYCFGDEEIVRVAERGGLLGCILCKHYITSGLPGPVSTFEQSVQALCAHIDKIRALTGSYDNIAIGSDLDGYIKPALPELEHMGRMKALQDALRARYGEEDAEKIASGNALRVLREHWGRGLRGLRW